MLSSSQGHKRITTSFPQSHHLKETTKAINMMLSSTTILAALTALTPLVQGQFARVENKCNVNAYVQSVPYDGSAAGPLVTLTPGRIFTEPFRASGSTVKISNQPSLQAPLFFGYSQSDTPYLMYYGTLGLPSLRILCCADG